MSTNLLRRLASILPLAWQQELRRLKYRHEIRQGKFQSEEPEFMILESMISHGDWVVDVGANIGHYTNRFSDLVGPHGRVIAVEPVPETFSLLSANVVAFRYRNVTLLNVAASDRAGIAGMQVPRFETGLVNYYQAHLSEEKSALSVLTVKLDSLDIPHPVRLIKVDTEGHDLAVLQAAESLLTRDHPILIVEAASGSVAEYLKERGYTSEKLAGSPNTVFR